MTLLPVHPDPALLHLPAGFAQRRGWFSPKNLRSLGNLDIAGTKKLALVCSKKCPGTLIVRTHDLAHTLRDAGITIIGGFHSPVEKECLRVLLNGAQPLVICPARSLEGMRVPTTWRAPIQQDRLLLLSPFEKKRRRPTAELAQQRNEFVASLADVVFIAYATPGSKTESLCRTVLHWGKKVLSFDMPENHDLIAMGVMPIGPSSTPDLLRSFGL